MTTATASDTLQSEQQRLGPTWQPRKLFIGNDGKAAATAVHGAAFPSCFDLVSAMPACPPPGLGSYKFTFAIFTGAIARLKASPFRPPISDAAVR